MPQTILINHFGGPRAAILDDIVGVVRVQVTSNLGASSSLDAVTIIRLILDSFAFAVVSPIPCLRTIKQFGQRVLKWIADYSSLQRCSHSGQATLVSHTVRVEFLDPATPAHRIFLLPTSLGCLVFGGIICRYQIRAVGLSNPPRVDVQRGPEPTSPSDKSAVVPEYPPFTRQFNDPE